jgi:hypothetical protein
MATSRPALYSAGEPLSPVPDIEGGQYHQVVVKLIMPAEVMAALAYLAAGADPTRASLEFLAVEPQRAN